MKQQRISYVFFLLIECNKFNTKIWTDFYVYDVRRFHTKLFARKPSFQGVLAFQAWPILQHYNCRLNIHLFRSRCSVLPRFCLEEDESIKHDACQWFALVTQTECQPSAVNFWRLMTKKHCIVSPTSWPYAGALQRCLYMYHSKWKTKKHWTPFMRTWYWKAETSARDATWKRITSSIVITSWYRINYILDGTTLLHSFLSNAALQR